MDYFMHYGVKGQKWGVRRFQEEDGSLTSEGMKRKTTTAEEDAKIAKKYIKKENSNGNEYKTPKSDEDVLSVMSYDSTTGKNGQSSFTDSAALSFLSANPKHSNLIYNYKDKNGNVALSYARVNGKDYYLKGKGNMDDLNLQKMFYKPPKMSEIYSTEDHFMHHGVKGQKWGVIRSEENKGSNPNISEKKLSEISPNQNQNINSQPQNKPNVPQNTQKTKQNLGIDFKREAIQAAQRAIIRAGATLLTTLLIQEGSKAMKIGTYAAEKAAYKNLAKNSPAAAMKLKDLAIGAEVLKPRK